MKQAKVILHKCQESSPAFLVFQNSFLFTKITNWLNVFINDRKVDQYL